MSKVATCLIITLLTGCNSELANVCKTKHCRILAKDVLSHMNQSVDPCENFYDFACGGFLNRKLKEDQVISSMATSLQLEASRNLLSSIKNRNNTKPTVAKRVLQKYFDSCLNLKNKNSSKMPILDDFYNLGGFPILDSNWTDEDFSMNDIVKATSIIGYGFNSLFSISVERMYEENGYYIHIYPPKLPLPECTYSGDTKDKNKTIAAYREYMRETLQLLREDGEIADDDLNEILAFEKKIASYVCMTSQEKQCTFLNLQVLDWKLNKIYFKDILRFLFNDVRNSDGVCVSSIDFLVYLDRLVQETSKRTLANYLLWRVTFDGVRNLNDVFLKSSQEFYKEINRIYNIPVMEDFCLEQITGRLKAALSAIYVADHFEESKKAQVENMYKKIAEEFSNTVKRTDWLSQETKLNIVKKIENTLSVIGHTDELKNETMLMKFLDPVHMETNFYENIKTLKARRLQDEFSLFWDIYDRSEWTHYLEAYSTNAFYDHSLTIVIPSGHLSGYSFHSDNPSFMNYAKVGYTIGHELMHAFDPVGLDIDYNGKEINWLSVIASKAFDTRQKCIEKHYSNLKLKNNQDQKTINEDIADNGGVEVTYKAYMSSLESKTDKTLPGLDYSPQQMFWVSLAQSECAIYRPEMLGSVFDGEHTIFQHRVNRMFQNQRTFADDFKCQNSSAMNPEEKCVVW
ncbi:Uncharacterised protein at_DN0155 [Pycnogonum litorale]